MNVNDYQKKTLETAIYLQSVREIVRDDPASIQRQLLEFMYVALGLGEVGEIQGKIKKMVRDGLAPSEIREALVDELGDVLYYCARLATHLGYSLEEVMERNYEKLSSRKERGVISGSGDNR